MIKNLRSPPVPPRRAALRCEWADGVRLRGQGQPCRAAWLTRGLGGVEGDGAGRSCCTSLRARRRPSRYTHTRARARRHTHAHTHTLMHTQTHKCTHTHTPTHTHTHNTQEHEGKHTEAHTRTRSHAQHTDTPPLDAHVTRSLHPLQNSPRPPLSRPPVTSLFIASPPFHVPVTLPDPHPRRFLLHLSFFF